jgi:hypothetical protein
MATACSRLRTFDPEDERSEPRLYSPSTFAILPRPSRDCDRFRVDVRVVALAISVALPVSPARCWISTFRPSACS